MEKAPLARPFTSSLFSALMSCGALSPDSVDNDLSLFCESGSRPPQSHGRSVSDRVSEEASFHLTLHFALTPRPPIFPLLHEALS